MEPNKRQKTQQSHPTSDSPATTEIRAINQSNLSEIQREIEEGVYNASESLELSFLDHHWDSQIPVSDRPILHEFLDALGRHLKHLRHISIKNLKGLPASALVNFLTQNNGVLESLYLERCPFRISDNERDGQEEKASMMVALQRLKCLEMGGCMEYIRGDQDISCNLLSLTAISRSAQIQKAKFFFRGPRGATTRQEESEFIPPFRQLLQHNVIQELEYDLRISNAFLVEVKSSVAQNTSLQKLVLGPCRFEANGQEALAQIIQNNNTLREINIALQNPLPQPFCHPWIMDDFLVAISRSLATNKSLKHCTVFLLGNIRATNVGGSAIFQALQNNCVLESLDISSNPILSCPIPSFWQRAIKTYLDLNRMGRSRFLYDFENVSRQEWIQLLTRFVNDLEGLFYLLKLNPSLCDTI